VLVRALDGQLYVLDRTYWRSLVIRHPKYGQGEIVAESNEMLSLTRLKDLTKEN
jgi:hypothetical protein